jgi:muramoyltetrapeptide carboxypeptidase
MSSTNRIPLYLIAPSGAVADINSALKGINWLSEKGFVPFNNHSIDRKYQRFAGTDLERVEEINSVAHLVNMNKTHSIAMGVRGGYGLSRILSSIDWDSLASAVDNGLTLVGHSDFTALSLALLAKSGRYSLSGPMLAPDFSNLNISEFTWNSFEKAVLKKEFDFNLAHEQNFVTSDFEINDGILWGGNLTILVSLLGTDFFPSPEKIDNGILFIEDINEHPYRIERMLLQLIESHALDNQKAIILGSFTEYKLGKNDDGYNFNNAILKIQESLSQAKLNIPIFNGFPFGHIPDKLTVPVGTRCKFQGNSFGFKIFSKWESLI